MATVIIELFGRHPMARVAKPPAAVSNGELSGTERFVQQERSHEPARALYLRWYPTPMSLRVELRERTTWRA